MAKLKQLQDKDGNNIFPLTIPQGIADPSSGEKLSDTLSSIKTFMQTVNDFLDAVNASDEAINSWKELENFLNGITDTETLTGLLSDTLAQAKAYADETAKNAEYDLPVATSSKLGGVLSGGDISVGTSGSVTVSHATSADTATTADTATEATHATSADTATSATNATNADHATSADTATKADTATEADHATSADTATSATTAEKVGSSTIGSTSRPVWLNAGSIAACQQDLDVDISGTANLAVTARSVYAGTSTDIEAEYTSENADLDIRTGGNVIVESNYRNVVIRSGSGTTAYGTGSVQIEGDTSIEGDLTVSGSISGVLTCVACNDTTDYPELTI